MKNLEELRMEIDGINHELLRLINQRTALVKEISDLKDESGMPYFDPVREGEMLEDLFANNRGPLPNELIKEVFTSIFSVSLQFMGIKKEKKLLISSAGDNGF